MAWLEDCYCFIACRRLGLLYTYLHTFKSWMYLFTMTERISATRRLEGILTIMLITRHDSYHFHSLWDFCFRKWKSWFCNSVCSRYLLYYLPFLFVWKVACTICYWTKCIFLCGEAWKNFDNFVCVHVFLYSRVTYTCFCVHNRGKILSYSNGNHQTPFCMRLTLPYLAFC